MTSPTSRQKKDEQPNLSVRIGLTGVAVLLVGALALGMPGAADHGEGEPECPDDLRRTQLQGGVVLLNWTHAPGSDESTVYRATGDGEMELLATVGSDQEDFYADDDTEPGENYTYEVRAVYGEHESADCPTVSGDIQEFPFPAPPPEGECPRHADLQASANPDESVFLEAEGLDRDTQLMRSEAGADDFVHIATLDSENNTYHDDETEAGTTYEYRLMVEDNVCATVEVTAIPFFTSGLLMGLSALGAVAAYAGIRRRS